jgi:hypothetical protein
VSSGDNDEDSHRFSLRSLLARVPVSVWLCVVFLATVITLLEGYPWINLQNGDTLNPANPYRTMFEAVNEGYAPLTDIQLLCTIDLTTDKDQILRDNAVSHVVGTAWHGRRFTIPCTRAVGAGNEPAISGKTAYWVSGNIISAKMTVKFTYAVCGINIKHLRRSQSFHMVAEKSVDGSFHWSFTAG